jgi:23S rRNA pseudouridine1911/1915/1917 synthase
MGIAGRINGMRGAMTDSSITVLYEDNHLLGVYKEAGRLVQGDRTGDITLLSLAKDYLKVKYRKPGNVYLGLVHRLDRPVSGVVLFARTSKAASRLAAEFRGRRVEKTYWAVVTGSLEREAGTLVNDLVRHGKHSRIAGESRPDTRRAELEYRTLAAQSEYTLIEVRPATGRHHQIRVQLAASGHPITGDGKYGSARPLPDRSIALHALRLRVKHPVKDDFITIEARPPTVFPWDLFLPAIDTHFG